MNYYNNSKNKTESKIISDKALTDLETSYINRGLRPLNFDNLYNFKAIATSSLGYKHTEEARLKMVDYYKDKNNHPSPISLFLEIGALVKLILKKH